MKHIITMIALVVFLPMKLAWGQWVDAGSVVHLVTLTDKVGIGTDSPVSQLDVDGDATFNKSMADKDFGISGDTISNLFKLDASEDQVQIGDPPAASKVNALLVLGNDPGAPGPTPNAEEGMIIVVKEINPVGARSFITRTIYAPTVNTTSSLQGFNAQIFYEGTGDLTATSTTIPQLRVGRYFTRISTEASGATICFAATLTAFLGNSANSGTITKFVSYNVEDGNPDGMDVTDLIGFNVSSVRSAIGTVTNQYGLKIDELLNSTNAWAVYTEGDTPSYFSGNVGIGTSTPSEKLTVNGNIKAEEIIVVVDVPADFVFEEDYQLMPLAEVEQYVKANKHLPDIPSGEEITANGLGVGEMQIKLLQKIEELTLYLLQQDG